MRHWLLAIVCFLLIADGYWASRNLVLKSADDGIYWFRFPFTGGQITIEAPTGQVHVEQNKQPPLEWKAGEWKSGGAPISDIRNFILYWNGPGDTCTVHYHLEPNASVAIAIKTLDLSFAAGVGRAAILSPVVERVGKPEDRKTALFFDPPKYDENNCPFEEEWRKSLPEYEPGIGYPPKLKPSKTPN